MFSCENPCGRTEDNAVIHEKTYGVLFASNDFLHAHIHKLQGKIQTKARATHVMLARASNTSLACAQSRKPLSDARAN